MNELRAIASDTLILSPDSRIFGSELRFALDIVGALAISVMHPTSCRPTTTTYRLKQTLRTPELSPSALSASLIRIAVRVIGLGSC